MEEKINSYFNDPTVKEHLAQLFELNEEETNEFFDSEFKISKTGEVT